MFGVQYSLTLQLTRFEKRRRIKQEEKLQNFPYFWDFLYVKEQVCMKQLSFQTFTWAQEVAIES